MIWQAKDSPLRILATGCIFIFDHSMDLYYTTKHSELQEPNKKDGIRLHELRF